MLARRILTFMAPSLAIIGAGMGGLTLAAALHQRGIEAQIYEQAPRFVRLGAGIQMSPNAMRVLRGIGLEPRIRATAFQPHSWTNRDWDTGKLTNELPLGADAEAKYGAPYLLMHRGDLHEALASRVPPRTHRARQEARSSSTGAVRRRRRCALPTAPAPAPMRWSPPTASIRGRASSGSAPRQANFTGRVAYRTTFPAALLDGYRNRPMLQMVGAGPPHRHLLRHGEPRRGLFRHQRAGAGVRRGILVGDRRPRTSFAPRSPVFTSRSGASSMPARACTNGRSSIAIPCPAGATAPWCCWATPPIR